LCEAAKIAVSDGLFDEGHCEAILGVVSDVGHLRSWLTTEQAQAELVSEGASLAPDATAEDARIREIELANMVNLARF
jgi:hypothetical protein